MAVRKRKRKIVVSLEFRKALKLLKKQLPDNGINMIAKDISKKQPHVSEVMNGYRKDHLVYASAIKIAKENIEHDQKVISDIYQLLSKESLEPQTINI